MGEDGKIRVVLADDHAVLRSGLKALINSEPDLEVIGEASNGREAVDLTETLKPDVVVMDIAMPDMNGLEATRLIQRKGLPSKVLVLTMYAEEQYLMQVLQAGGSGYVLKRSADTELMEAIRAVNRGEAFLYPGATKMLLEEYLRGSRPEAADAARKRLTEREQEVLTLTAEGYTNQEIADRLFISPKTVDTYRQRIMEKLDLHHRSELVRYALDKGFLTAEHH